MVAVQALQVVYSSLNNPSQLTGWKMSGGDPCGESWKGVTCEGSAVVSMYVSIRLRGGDVPFSSFILLITYPCSVPVKFLG